MLQNLSAHEQIVMFCFLKASASYREHLAAFSFMKPDETLPSIWKHGKYWWVSAPASSAEGSMICGRTFPSAFQACAGLLKAVSDPQCRQTIVDAFEKRIQVSVRSRNALANQAILDDPAAFL